MTREAAERTIAHETANEHPDQPIIRRVMTEREISSIGGGHLPHPAMFHQFEFAVYDRLKSICREYAGGRWEFYQLSNGAWFMAPVDEPTFTLQDCYGRDHPMSAEGAGLAAMAYLLNHLSWVLHEKGRKEQCDSAVDHYYALLAYANQGKDAAAIRAVLD